MKTLKSNILTTNVQVRTTLRPFCALLGSVTGIFRTSKYRSVTGVSNDGQSDETWMNLRPRIDVRRLSCSINMLSASWVTLALPNIDDTVRPSASRSYTQTNPLLTARVSHLMKLWNSSYYYYYNYNYYKPCIDVHCITRVTWQFTMVANLWQLQLQPQLSPLVWVWNGYNYYRRCLGVYDHYNCNYNKPYDMTVHLVTFTTTTTTTTTTNLAWVYNKGHVTVHHGGKLAEGTNDHVLSIEPVNRGGRRRAVDAEHELKIIDNNMRNVVDVHCMWHRLYKQ